MRPCDVFPALINSLGSLILRKRALGPCFRTFPLFLLLFVCLFVVVVVVVVLQALAVQFVSEPFLCFDLKRSF